MDKQEIKSLSENVHELFNNSKKSGCPLCSMISDYEFNLLAQIQYDVVNNEIVRNKIAHNGGFCDFHFRQFKKIANGKTNILLLKTIIEAGSYKKIIFTINCDICNAVGIYEAEIVKTLPSFFNDQNFRSGFEKSIGICFNHLDMVKELITDKDILTWLINTHVIQIERLQADFNQMNGIESFYEIDLSKRKLINILIEKLAGRKTRSL